MHDISCLSGYSLVNPVGTKINTKMFLGHICVTKSNKVWQIAPTKIHKSRVSQPLGIAKSRSQKRNKKSKFIQNII